MLPISLARKLCFTALLFFLTQFNYAQNTTFTVTGMLVDSITQEPIEQVNIKIKDGKGGTASDELGYFKISVSQLPFSLEFSHVSYHSFTVSFNYPPSRHLVLGLKPKQEKLPEVFITAQKIDTIYKNDLYTVLDYELTDRGILLLIYKGNLTNAELLYTDFDGKEKSGLRVLPARPLALFGDCLNNVHLLTRSSAYQLYFDDNNIKVMPGEDIEKFKSIMGSCLFSLNNKLYFEQYTDLNFAKRVFYIHTADSSFTELAVVTDPDKFNMLRDNPDDWILFGGGTDIPGPGDLKGLGSDANTLDQIRHLTADTRFIKMAYYDELYAPVLPIGDSVCIFNHPGNRIDFYNTNDSLAGSTSIHYHRHEKTNQHITLARAFVPSNKWIREIYTDPAGRKAYTMFRNINGTRDLMNINLGTGETTYVLTIPFPYVQKIKIYNNYLYFVYRGWGNAQKKKLFRQKIF